MSTLSFSSVGSPVPNGTEAQTRTVHLMRRFAGSGSWTVPVVIRSRPDAFIIECGQGNRPPVYIAPDGTIHENPEDAMMHHVSTIPFHS